MATYQQQAKRSIQKTFEEYHDRNPDIYKVYCQLVNQMILLQQNKGVPDKKIKISSKHIMGKIRWEVFIGVDKIDDYKINDIYSSRYARIYIEQYPDRAHYFNQKALRSD